MSATDGRIAELAVMWITAERQRRMCKVDRGKANLVAEKIGLVLDHSPDGFVWRYDGRRTDHCEAHQSVVDANAAYQEAAKNARILRRMLMKAAVDRLKPVEPHPEIHAAYTELCERERATFESAVGRMG